MKRLYACILSVLFIAITGCATTPLMNAAGKGDIKEAERLLAGGDSVNEGDTFGQTPLHFAAIIDIHTIPDFKAIPRQNDITVIIGIENYQGLPKSDYSKSDADIVKDYLKALGFQERNIELLTDGKATFSGITKTIETWLPNRVKKESRVFIYYSGHGAPDPSTGEAYLVPYDGDPNYLEVTGYPLKRLYDKLGKLQVAEVTVVLDACFSGAGGRSVLAKGARPLVMMADVSVLSSNMAVLSATQGTQISTSSPEKGHGVFTYYFLKAIKDGKKNIAEIYEYIKPLVEDEAKQLNVQQSPSISPDVEKLKGRFLFLLRR
ncbi:MAG: caspase family protein [Thermodesulfovibrionales bacterium]|nr:caspase family protein [Nitrospinota bacterium]MCG2709175.1 caspase family protein [Thermodesulfovibrionales bacterium]